MEYLEDEENWREDIEEYLKKKSEKLDEVEDSGDAENTEKDLAADLEALNYDSVSKIEETQRYTDVLKKVEDAQGMVLEDYAEYQLIVECTTLSLDIEKEIVNIDIFIREKYQRNFPKVEMIVRHPFDYARIVKKIENKVDLTHVNFEGMLPSYIIRAIFADAWTTTIHKPLPEDVFRKIIDACDRVIALYAANMKLYDFVEKRTGYVEPNLSSAFVHNGVALAAKHFNGLRI